ncbi:MAG: hypothetical protein JSS10_00695 [Verrucomicrobia bacterium]|nr:hypothetical protein [Verrucomicrobiota bacterium]
MAAGGVAQPLVHPKPPTNWDVLAGPIETSGQKVRRVLGQFLTFLTLPSTGAVYYIYHYMTDTPERVLAAYKGTRIFTVATFVTGVAFWYFNRLGDLPQRLAAERKNLEQKITKTPLATIHDTHLHVVFSNSELNEWMRYLLQEQGYEAFIKFQTEAIFGLQLEEKSRALLREKYLEYLKTPCPEGMIALDKQIAFHDLVGLAERQNAREITAEKEAQDAVSYQAFIERNGSQALVYIKNEEIKKKLFANFLEYVRQKNLGLIETKKQFADDITAFGGKALQDVEEVVQNLELLSAKSYQEFRERNGFEQLRLLATGNPTVHTAFKEKFLKLPYTVQVSPAFQEDRNLLNITEDDIKKAMKHRWISKYYSEILKTERDEFLAYMKAEVSNTEGKKIWTTKAVVETRNLSIQAILQEFSDLFAAGILTANEGGLKARAAAEISRLTLAQLFDTYGDGIFIYGLMDPAAIPRLVGDFVSLHASAYLGIDSNSPTSSYIGGVANLNLASFLADEIQEGQRQVTETKSLHSKQVRDINDRHNRYASELDQDLPIKIQREREAVKDAEGKLHRAQDAARPHTERIARITNLIGSYESQITDANNQLEQKNSVREALLDQKENLNNQPAFNLPAYESQLQTEQKAYADAEAKMNNDPLVVQIQGLIANLTPQLAKLENEVANLRTLKGEYDILKDEVESDNFKTKKQALQKAVDTPIPENVTGVAAARNAQALQEAKKKNGAELEGMKTKEKRWDELTSQMQSQKNLNQLMKSAEFIRKQISEQQSLLDKRREALASATYLPIRRTAIQQLSRAIETYKANQQRLQQIQASLEKLRAETTGLKSTREDAIMHRDTQKAELTIAQRASQEPFLALETAAQMLKTAQQSLESKIIAVKAEIQRRKELRGKERLAELEAASSAYQVALQQIRERFQGTILTKANPPPPTFT